MCGKAVDHLIGTKHVINKDIYKEAKEWNAFLFIN